MNTFQFNFFVSSSNEFCRASRRRSVMSAVNKLTEIKVPQHKNEMTGNCPFRLDMRTLLVAVTESINKQKFTRHSINSIIILFVIISSCLLNRFNSYCVPWFLSSIPILHCSMLTGRRAEYKRYFIWWVAFACPTESAISIRERKKCRQRTAFCFVFQFKWRIEHEQTVDCDGMMSVTVNCRKLKLCLFTWIIQFVSPLILDAFMSSARPYSRHKKEKWAFYCFTTVLTSDDRSISRCRKRNVSCHQRSCAKTMTSTAYYQWVSSSSNVFVHNWMVGRNGIISLKTSQSQFSGMHWSAPKQAACL